MASLVTTPSGVVIHQRLLRHSPRPCSHNRYFLPPPPLSPSTPSTTIIEHHHAFTLYFLIVRYLVTHNPPYDTPSNNSPRITPVFSITVPILVNRSPWLPQLHQLHLHHASIFIVMHVLLVSFVSFRGPTVLRTWYSHVYSEHVSILIVMHISLVSSL